jgi:hypothetical protein
MDRPYAPPAAGTCAELPYFARPPPYLRGAAPLPSFSGVGGRSHTFASLMIAAGVNAKALSTFLGHASVTITLDRYGYLFPGSEKEAGASSTATSNAPSEAVPREGALHVRSTALHTSAIFWGREGPPGVDERRSNGAQTPCKSTTSTEGEGFEPSVDRKAHNGFRDRPVQPLRHPSGAFDSRRHTDQRRRAGGAMLDATLRAADTGREMSHEDVDLLRAGPISPEGLDLRAMAETAFEALNAGDLDGYLALIAEDVEFTSLVAEAEGTAFRGHEGVRVWWETVRGAFQDPQWELLDVRGSSDRAVTKFRMTGSLSGVPVAQTMWQASRAHEGKLTWWAFFRTEREALDAVAQPE